MLLRQRQTEENNTENTERLVMRRGLLGVHSRCGKRKVEGEEGGGGGEEERNQGAKRPRANRFRKTIAATGSQGLSAFDLPRTPPHTPRRNSSSSSSKAENEGVLGWEAARWQAVHGVGRL
eukprot:1765113-Rhodomonas_salina.1